MTKMIVNAAADLAATTTASGDFPFVPILPSILKAKCMSLLSLVQYHGSPLVM